MAKLAFDTGGTFTDFALIDDAGDLHLHKVLSTPLNPADAVIQGVGDLLDRYKATIDPATVQVLGATTVVTNAVLERKGAQTALITTKGFEDILRIRNEGRYDLYDLKIQYPDPLVSRADTFGADERITAEGHTVRALDEEGVRALGANLTERGLKSVAVCLLRRMFTSRFLLTFAQKCVSLIVPRPPWPMPTPAP
jgi:N-methylhydantoinase A